MKETYKRRLQTGIILAFYVIVVSLLVYSRIQAYSLVQAYKPLELRNHPVWLIPLVYLYDYFSHTWICLLFAFSIAELIYEIIPKEIVTRYMGSSRITGYAMAIGIAPFLTVCSCTMVPLFAGVLYSGASIGPALTFLIMALASILGGSLYTPTLVEIVLGRGIWVREGVILSRGALLSWLRGQPHDFANALAVSKITGWKIVINYVIIAWIRSVTFGLLYRLLSGSL